MFSVILLFVSLHSAQHAAASDYVDHRNCVTTVGNQGSCASCWAFASSAAIEVLLCKHRDLRQILSPQDLMDCTDNPCEPASSQVGAKFVVEHGIATAADVPYTKDYSHCQDVPRIRGFGYELIHRDDRDVTSYLHYGPLTIKMFIPPNLKKYESGLFHSDSCGKNSHEMLIVGYYIDETIVYVVRNSWGKTWGESGYMHIPSTDPCIKPDFGRYYLNSSSTWPILAAFMLLLAPRFLMLVLITSVTAYNFKSIILNEDYQRDMKRQTACADPLMGDIGSLYEWYDRFPSDRCQLSPSTPASKEVQLITDYQIDKNCVLLLSDTAYELGACSLPPKCGQRHIETIDNTFLFFGSKAHVCYGDKLFQTTKTTFTAYTPDFIGCDYDIDALKPYIRLVHDSEYVYAYATWCFAELRQTIAFSSVDKAGDVLVFRADGTKPDCLPLHRLKIDLSLAQTILAMMQALPFRSHDLHSVYNKGPICTYEDEFMRYLPCEASSRWLHFDVPADANLVMTGTEPPFKLHWVEFNKICDDNKRANDMWEYTIIEEDHGGFMTGILHSFVEALIDLIEVIWPWIWELLEPFLSEIWETLRLVLEYLFEQTIKVLDLFNLFGPLVLYVSLITCGYDWLRSIFLSILAWAVVSAISYYSKPLF